MNKHEFFFEYQAQDFPVKLEDFKRIEHKLRSKGIIIISDYEIDPYNAGFYLQQEAFYGSSTYAVLDVNVLIDILSIARHGNDQLIERREIGASLLVFAQCANITLEPGVALNESPHNVAEELEMFYRLDNTDTNYLLEIALDGRYPLHENRMPIIDKPHIPPLSKKLKGDQALQTAVLKIANLTRRKDITGKQKFEHYLRWSHEEFLFSKEAIILAMQHFSPSNSKKLLKSYDSLSGEKRFSGVKNAVWDLLRVRDWANKMSKSLTDTGNSPHKIWLFCTRDVPLQKLICELVLLGDQIEEEVRLKMFQKWWGNSAGKYFFELLEHLTHEKESVNRKLYASNFDEHCFSLYAALKNELIKN